MYGHFTFYYVMQSEEHLAFTAWIGIGGMSFEYLEMLCQEYKARKRRQRIRMHIRQFREYVKHNIEGWRDDE